MGKPKNSNAVNHGEVKYEDPRMAHMATKKDFIKMTSNKMISELNPNVLIDEKIVIAEDQNGLYLTGMSYAGANILDKYRMYKRNEYKVEANNNTFNVTYIPLNKTITL